MLGSAVGKVKKLTEEHRLYLNQFDEHALIAKPDDASGNLMRHFKSLATSSSVSVDTQVKVYRALLDVSENAKGGFKPKQQLKFEGEGIKTVAGFKSVSKDARPLLLRCALFGAAKHVPYAVLEDPFFSSTACACLTRACRRSSPRPFRRARSSSSRTSRTSTSRSSRPSRSCSMACRGRT